MVNVIIRDELPGDVNSIEAVTIAAFQDVAHADHREQFIVQALREAGALSISLVAELQGEVVGHVAVSAVTISDGTEGWFGLGLISVKPEHQSLGIGSQLMGRELKKLQNMGASGCVLLDDPAYYSRFGFKPRRNLVLPDIPPEYFQALSFNHSFPSGLVTYHDAFGVSAQ